MCRRILILQFSLLFYILIIQSLCCNATDTLNQSRPLLANQTLVSAGQVFELGFFRPNDSSRLYLGMWYKNIPVRRFVWVANRERPLAANDSASSLRISPDGNLRLEDGEQNIVWSTNVSEQSNKSVAVLSDQGNFALRDNASGSIFWQSFDNPTDTLLPGMTLSSSRARENRSLTSWKADNDPAPGGFMGGPTVEEPPQLVIQNGSVIHWRSGPWNGLEFLGIVFDIKGYELGINIRRDQQGTVYYEFNTHDSYTTVLQLTPSGSYVLVTWRAELNQWNVTWEVPDNPCDLYETCGPFGLCNRQKSPICQCMEGYIPRLDEEWRNSNWRSGCVRRTPFLCERNASNSNDTSSQNDGFQLVREMKLPDQFEFVYRVDNQGCQQRCLSNCSCVGYAYPDGIGCMLWADSLIDSYQIPSEGEGDLFLRLPYSELDIPGGGDKSNSKLVISLTTVSGVVLVVIFLFCFWWWKYIQRGRRRKSEKYSDVGDEAFFTRNTSELQKSVDHTFVTSSTELPIIDFAILVSSTDNFSLANKLGEGGFGPVYRGKLQTGQDIAVKRLSIHSGQGIEEFKNEIMLISELQHRNLVRLLGCCIHGDEKLLVYEYMKNKSLDAFIFDSTKKLQLDWTRRFHIIQGIARGILYLHRDSLLRIIHRDLKASNVLLDDDMNPKISDFGLARTFKVTQEQVNTHRVVGTFGYMSPEYAIWGLFSDKSDVYSFGVLLLEIVSGKKNTGFMDDNYLSLLGYAWKLWDEEEALNLVDESIAESSSPSEVMRCIHIGLLCVQDQPADRPTMSDVVFMLSSEADLPQPKKPAFTLQSWLDSTASGSSPMPFPEISDNISLIESR